MGFKSSFAPLVRRGEKVDHLVDLADALVQTETNPIERHLFALRICESYEPITPGMCQGSEGNSIAAAETESVRALAGCRAHRAEPNWTSLAAGCKPRPGERGCEAAGMAVVTLDGIGRNYGAGVAVLSEISLTLEAGEFCFLTGAPGAGKTTLLNIIALAEEPSAGRLTRSEEHTSELQSHVNLVCRLLLE